MDNDQEWIYKVLLRVYLHFWEKMNFCTFPYAQILEMKQFGIILHSQTFDVLP